MSRPHWCLVAVFVAGLTILSVPGYAQITVEAVGVSALTTARQTECLLVELTREGGNSTDSIHCDRDRALDTTGDGRKVPTGTTGRHLKFTSLHGPTDLLYYALHSYYIH